MAIPTPENFDPTAVSGAVNAQKEQMLRLAAAGGTTAMQAAAVAQAAISATGGQAAYFQQLAAQQGTAGKTFTDQLGAANSQYMDQLNAAIPISHEQTQRELNSLSAAAENAEQERMMRKLLAEMQLQETRERIAFSREDRERAAAHQGTEDELAARRLDLQSRDLDLDERKLAMAEAAGPNAQRSDNEIEAARNTAWQQITKEMQDAGMVRSMPLLSAVIADAKGNPAAASGLLTQGIEAEFGQASKGYTTADGRRKKASVKLDQRTLQDYLNRYYGA